MAKVKKVKSNSSEESKIEILKQGMNSEFWRLIKEAIEDSIDHIQTQMDAEEMKNLSAAQYKFMNESMKAKKEYLHTLLKTPENLISWLEKPATDEPKDFDPY